MDGVWGYDRLPWTDWEPDTVSVTRTAEIDDLQPGFPYWVRVRAVNARGDGAWSEFSSRSMYIPPALEMTKDCVKNATTTLALARSCRITAGVGGVGSFDTATITAGSGVITSDGRTNPDKAEFIAINPEGGAATVKTYNAGAEVDTFNISVTPFRISSAVAAGPNPAPGGTFPVGVSLVSPINHTFYENVLDLNAKPIEGLYARSWVKLELPAGWTGTDHSGASVQQPVQLVGYNGSTVNFTVNVPSNAAVGTTTIPVKAYTRDLPPSCGSHCYQNYKKEDIADLDVTVAGGVIGMAVVSQEGVPANPPAPVEPWLNATSNSLTAKWRAPSSPAAPITGYEAQYRHYPNGNWTTWTMPEADTLSATLTGLEPGETYRVRVRAQNAFGWGAYTYPPVETTLPYADPPEPVGSVSAQRSGGDIAVTWTAPARAAGYDVVYSTNNKYSWARLATSQTSTSYTIEDASAVLSYVVAVRAVNDAGESGWTNSNLVPATATPEPKPQPPAGVTGLSASRAGNVIETRWSAAGGATGYDVVYSSDGKHSWTRAATNQSGTSYTLSNASNSKSYVFAVRAVNSSGASGWTNSAPVPALEHPPGGVASVTVVHNGGSVSVTWTAADRAAGYDVVYSTDGRQSWSRAATNHSGNSYTLTGADAAKTYVFAVRAVNSAGSGGWTNSAPAQPPE